MTKIFNVNFEVSIDNVADMEANITLKRFIARQLSISLMLEQLGVNEVIIDNTKFNIDAMRHRRGLKQ